jgi:copper homeostasis protein
MVEDISQAKARNVDGIVLGVLTKNGTVDVARTRELIAVARPLQVTFHKAFDVCEDLDRALEDVIACGADRILTSGGKVDAMRGAATIAHLHEKAGSRIVIMAGGGIRESNLRAIALQTGVSEFHSSLSRSAEIQPSDRAFANQNGPQPFRVFEHDVRGFKSALNAIAVEQDLGSPRA